MHNIVDYQLANFNLQLYHRVIYTVEQKSLRISWMFVQNLGFQIVRLTSPIPIYCFPLAHPQKCTHELEVIYWQSSKFYILKNTIASYIFLYLFIYLFTYLSFCLCICSFIHPTIHLSVHIYVYLQPYTVGAIKKFTFRL